MGGLGPFSADAERGTVVNLLYPRAARAAWASASAGVEAGTGSYRRDLGQCTMSRSMIVKSHHMTEQWVSLLGDDVLDTGKIGGGDDLGVSDKIIPADSTDHTLAAHMEGLELP